MKKNLLLKSTTIVPLIDVELRLFVARDPNIVFESNAARLFDLDPNSQPFHARATRGRGRYGLYFTAAKLDHDDIGHEVRHIVEFIIDYFGHDATPCDEFGPLLSGFIAKWVYRQLKKAKIRVTT